MYSNIFLFNNSNDVFALTSFFLFAVQILHYLFLKHIISMVLLFIQLYSVCHKYIHTFKIVLAKMHLLYFSWVCRYINWRNSNYIHRFSTVRCWLWKCIIHYLSSRGYPLIPERNPFFLVVKSRSHLESVKDGFIVLKNSTNYNLKNM